MCHIATECEGRTKRVRKTSGDNRYNRNATSIYLVMSKILVTPLSARFRVRMCRIRMRCHVHVYTGGTSLDAVRVLSLSVVTREISFCLISATFSANSSCAATPSFLIR